jgi:hypothetical protein
MRSLLLAICLLSLVVLPCFAQQPTVPVTPKSTTQTPETKTLTGEVKSVTLADPIKGTKSEIVVVDKSQTEPREYTFLVKSTTTIYNTDWNAITLDKITKGQNVKVKYTTTKEGVNEAVSINLKK